MTIVKSLLIAALGASVVIATPLKQRTPYVVKETHFVPKAWTRIDRAPADHVIDLNIGLQQGQFAELERHLYEVSDPSHARYGQHLSQDEVNELVKPSAECHDSVHEWLYDNGIEPHQLGYSPARDWITVSLPVSEVERLLVTEYSIYEHEDGMRLVRTPDWSLPKHLHDHVMTIQPTNSFLRAAPVSREVKPLAGPNGLETVPFQEYVEVENPTVAKVCNITNVTPRCLRTLYGTIDYNPKATDKNKIALTNYLKETNNRSDVSIFLKQFRPDAAKYAYQFPFTIINHGNNQQTPNTPKQLKAGKDVEGDLDAETIIALTYPTPMRAYNTGGMPPFKPDDNTPTDTNEPYLTWLHYVLKQKDLPQVVSNSYDDEERTVPPSFAKAVCQGFAQLGARGTTLFFGSGDTGVGTNNTCHTNNGKNTRQFTAQFPSSCPYITSVGATKNFSPEVVAYDPENGFSSGGGFSNYFPRPKYQDSIVPAYIKSLGGKYDGLYNKSGRAYPDIAAQGQRFVIVYDGENVHVDGTSAATPTAASIIALVNDALIAAGKKPLGFLNPWLYSGGYKAFTDVTNGSTLGCHTEGFPAAEGYDTASGFGTPNFPKILKNLGLTA